METNEKLKRLRQIEGTYLGLEASIADIDCRLAERPRDHDLKADCLGQRAKLSLRKFEAEALRIELGMPMEEEDPNRTI